MPTLFDRSIPPQFAGELAQVFEASGVVDYFNSWDQLTSWWPRALWTPGDTPMAEVMPDCDSFADAFILGAYAAAATKHLGVAVTTDAIRRGPAEVMQTMLTLAAGTEGRAMLMLGAGELKQTRPFGYKRSEGLQRLEDHLRLYHLLRECKEPFDFDGNIWKYQQAWIGTARPYQPKICVMGAGPKILELAATFADGITVPAVWAFSPEQFAELVVDIRQQLERAGRDPDEFTFGVWGIALLHEDPAMIEKAFDNALVQWCAAAFGRMKQEWEEEGLTPVFDRGWHYALNLLPAQMTRAECDEINASVSRQMLEKSYIRGTPEQVADGLQAFVDAGANWVSIIDLLPVLLTVEEAQAALQRTIEVCRILKSRN